MKRGKNIDSDSGGLQSKLSKFFFKSKYKSDNKETDPGLLIGPSTSGVSSPAPKSMEARSNSPEFEIGLNVSLPPKSMEARSNSPEFEIGLNVEDIGYAEEIVTTACDEPSSSGPGVRSNKPKKKYSQKYLTAWEAEKAFKGWLCKAISNNPTEGDVAYCKVCEQRLTCGKSELLRHSESKRHLHLLKSVVSSQDITKVLCTPLENKARRGELKWASMLAEKNLPISLMDTLIPLAASIYDDSKIAAKMKSKRTKTTSLLKNVLGPEFKIKLCQKLKNFKFSLIMDETTDVGSIKQCAFSVVFFDDEKNNVSTEFLHMAECPKGDAETLFQVLKSTLLDNEIPIVNMVGFCSDTTNVMAGSHNSVFSKLKRELPQICLLKCSCHQLHLASAWACKKIPNEIEDLVRDIYAHFHRSFQRQVVLREFQAFYETESHKILRSSQTRWLSLKESIDRVLEQMEPLKRYFMTEVFEDSSVTTQNILYTLNKKTTRCYLYFLSYILDLVTGLNVLFQTEGPVLLRLKPQLEKAIKDISMNFMKVQYVRETNPWKIDPHNEELHLKKEEIYLGLQAHQEVTEMQEEGNNDNVNNFYEHCKNFYITLVSELQKRFEFSDKVFTFLKVLEPKEAQQLSVPSLKPVFDRFSFYLHKLSYQNVDSQWRQHGVLNHDEYGLDNTVNIVDYWSKVFKLKNPAGQTLFPDLKEVMSLLMCLPASNSSVERLFSQLKLVKTVHRNKLETSTICALIHTKQGVKDCINFEPSNTLLKKKWKDT